MLVSYPEPGKLMQLYSQKDIIEYYSF